MLLGFDLETYPIGPKRAPQVIVGAFNIADDDANALSVSTWATRVASASTLEAEGGAARSVYFFWASELSNFLTLCEKIDGPVVAHNGAYDWSCISAMDPAHIGRIYGMFSKRKLQCTYIRTLISLNSNGELKTVGNSKLPLRHGKYGATSMVGATYMFTGFDLSELKDEEVQVTYYKVEGVPFGGWPEKYRDYLVQDVAYLPQLFYAQELTARVTLLENGKEIYIFDEAPRRATFHYALTMASAWGMRVDPNAVAELRQAAEDGVRDVASRLVDGGIAVYLEGAARERAVKQGKLPVKLDLKRVQAIVEECYTARGEAVPMAEKGGVSTARTVLMDCGHPLLREWAEVGEQKTVWSTFVPALEKSFNTNMVLNTSFFPYSETGRISAREPNLLNPPRSGGIRECVVARPGCTFIFCDYEANELRVLAQVLLDMFGQSRLAELYQNDKFFDPHTYMACQRLGITYEEGKRLKKEGDKQFKFQRQLMKCCNFGFPGGMAASTFIEFAKGYGVQVTEEQAAELKSFFLSQFPEIGTYLQRVGVAVNRYKGQGYLARAGRLSGDRRFCQLANFYFQGLAAEGGLTAFTMVSKAAYTEPSSPLYGCRPVLFVHDEIIVEAPLAKAHAAAMELQRQMQSWMGRFTPDVPSVAEPTMATRWWKDAYQKFDADGRMVPSDI
jgi:hypothetical protein